MRAVMVRAFGLRVFVLLLGSLFLSVATQSLAATVTKAADVCPLDADPCDVTSQMDIPDGLCSDNSDTACTTNTDCAFPAFCHLGAVILDFGVRDVVVTGGGKFNFGTASGEILCGDFSASTTNAAIDAAGVPAGGGTDSGTVRLFARRKCSVGGADAPACLADNDCNAGACGTRRCSLRPAHACASDGDCNAGPCTGNSFKKCALDQSVVCLTNADCNLGTCPAQLTCSAAANAPHGCTTNADCNFGGCSVGTASINMNGPIIGSSASPAVLDLRAADDINVTKPVNLAGTAPDANGGELRCKASFGSISFSGVGVTVKSGSLAGGGYVSLDAGTDVIVNAELDASGGDLSGGSIDLKAGRDVVIARSLFANSTSGGGGGDLDAIATRDLVVSGVSPSDKTTLETNGQPDQFNENGNGGTQTYSAGRNLTLNINTRLASNGNALGGIAGFLSVEAGDTLTMNGDVDAKSLGAAGVGGEFEAISAGPTIVGASGALDVSGGSGKLVFLSGKDLSFAGTADIGAGIGGAGGTATLQSDVNVNVSGTVRNNAGNQGLIELRGCYVTLTSTGELDSNLTDSDNTIESGEQIQLAAGSLMKTGPLGSNSLVYRTSAKAPLMSGTISPGAQLMIDDQIAGCVICGNGLLDGGESCEDGNTASGDGCNSECQNEACIAQTAAKVACDTNADCGARQCEQGFCSPWELCEDGNVCTTDSCNDAANSCVHAPRDCGDAFSCTVDTCSEQTGQCVHTPNDAACADDNECSDETCSAATGCVVTPNTNSCDDGVECTTNDVCADFACTGTPGNECEFCGDGQKTGSEACDDGNATYASGEYCGLDCATLVPCGKTTAQTGAPKSSDAQYALRAAVGQVSCSLRVCDVDNSSKIVASDAQRILRKAVGQDVTLNCPGS